MKYRILPPLLLQTIASGANLWGNVSELTFGVGRGLLDQFGVLSRLVLQRQVLLLLRILSVVLLVGLPGSIDARLASYGHRLAQFAEDGRLVAHLPLRVAHARLLDQIVLVLAQHQVILHLCRVQIKLIHSLHMAN